MKDFANICGYIFRKCTTPPTTPIKYDHTTFYLIFFIRFYCFCNILLIIASNLCRSNQDIFEFYIIGLHFEVRLHFWYFAFVSRNWKILEFFAFEEFVQPNTCQFLICHIQSQRILVTFLHSINTLQLLSHSLLQIFLKLLPSVFIIVTDL